MRKFAFVFAVVAASAAFAQEGAFTQLQGPIRGSDYPLALGDRPLVLPNLFPEGSTWFEYYKLSPTNNQSAIGLRVGMGVADIAQVDVLSSYVVDPNSDWSKTMAARVGVLAYDSRELDIAPSLYVPFDFHDGADLVSQMTIGAETRYRINHMFYAYGLRDLVGIGFGKNYGNEFNLGLNGTFGVGVEPIQHLSLELEATLIHLKVAGNAAGGYVSNAFYPESIVGPTKGIFADDIPVALKALVAVNRNFDIMGQIIATDLKNGFDAFTFVGGLNARL